MTETWPTDDRAEELVTDMFTGDATPVHEAPVPVQRDEVVYVNPNQRRLPLVDPLDI